MSLVPQGVSGTSAGGASPISVWPDIRVAPGTIYHLGRWTGQTLRKLILSSAVLSYVYGRIQIATDYPRHGLHPGRNALPNPLVDFPFVLSSSFPVLNLDFAPGLVTVPPGENIYLIVYDFMGEPSAGIMYASMDETSAAITWGLNMLWEPLGCAR